jgi:hypothetical protein
MDPTRMSLYMRKQVTYITRQKPSFATIRKYALLCALHDHDLDYDKLAYSFIHSFIHLLYPPEIHIHRYRVSHLIKS